MQKTVPFLVTVFFYKINMKLRIMNRKIFIETIETIQKKKNKIHKLLGIFTL